MVGERAHGWTGQSQRRGAYLVWCCEEEDGASRVQERREERQGEPTGASGLVSKSRPEWRGRGQRRTAIDGALETRGRAESGSSRASAAVRPNKRNTLELV